MRRLSEDIKRRIVEHLACFRTHAEVVMLIGEEFEVTLTPRHVRAYDPTSCQFAGSARWLDHYRHVRKRCTDEVGEIAIAYRTFRLRRLTELHDKAIETGNLKEARKVLEQVAKEMGNYYVR